ncbi:phage holin family protein [Streptomyces phyllanthi]|uniref:Phage holin family protein n=1 Tax=Streptomyces phyllanthi TaxID=1803180 RepID=A0A5N8VVJ1_9ACTN|nr:phage holin family protein [Streptomyces phyllanthi]MPY39009.1 phage holin family protein [Streptomyces phyllanthi]
MEGGSFEAGAVMRERTTKALWWLVMGSASTWGAAQVTRGVELDGPAGRQALTVLTMLAVSTLGHLPVLAVKHGLPRLVRVDAVRRHEGAVACLVTVVTVGAAVVMAPLLWWLAETVCALLDLPLRISGFWPFVVVALVDLLLGLALTALRGSLTSKGRAQGAVGRLGRLAVCFGVLWLLTSALGGVRLEADEWWRAVIAMVVSAVLFSLLGTGFTLSHDLGWPDLRRLVLGVLPFLAVGSLAGGALVLWLVSWFGTGLRPTLHVSGFGTFLSAGVITAVVLWAAGLPFFLYGLKRRGTDAPQGGPRPLSVRATGFGYVWPRPRPTTRTRTR